MMQRGECRQENGIGKSRAAFIRLWFRLVTGRVFFLIEV